MIFEELEGLTIAIKLNWQEDSSRICSRDSLQLELC